MAIHEDYIELISAAVDGTLTEVEAARLQSHLAQCEHCRSLLRDMQDLHAALRSLPAVEPPADLSERILTAVAQDKVTPFPARRTMGWKRWASSAAVIALVLAGAWTLRGGSDRLVGQNKNSVGIQTASAEGMDLEGIQEKGPRALPDPDNALDDLLSDEAGPAPQSEGSQEDAPLQPAQAVSAQAAEPLLKMAAGAAAGEATPAAVETPTAVETLAPTQPPMLRSALVPTGDSGADSVEGNAVQSTVMQPSMFSLPLPSEMPEEVPEAVVVTDANGLPPVPAQPLTPRQALETLIDQQSFTGYTWVEDQDVATGADSPLARTPAILWMDGSEGITYLNYHGLSPEGDCHLFQMDHMAWDNDPGNLACPKGTVTPLTRYCVPVTGEGDIRIESLEQQTEQQEQP